MARLPRPDLAGIAQHVVPRGNDRMPCFLGDPDRLLYLQALREMSMRYACSIHAYVLMTDHVHLLVTPEGTLTYPDRVFGGQKIKLPPISRPKAVPSRS